MSWKPVLLTLLAGVAVALAPIAIFGKTLPLGEGWRFFKGDISGAEQPRFDDSNWASVPVPHDWSIAGPFAETNAAADAFLPTGVAWYRCHFALPANALGQNVSVEFESIRNTCDLWINGMHLGHHAHAAAGVRYQLSPTMLGFGTGTNNVLVVCASTTPGTDNAGYTGAGICGPVHLIISDVAHTVPDRISVIATNISHAEATVQIETTLTNESTVARSTSLQTTLISPDGDTLGGIESSKNVDPAGTAVVEQQIPISSPRIWSCEHPFLYQVVEKLRGEGQVADEQTIALAIRDPKLAQTPPHIVLLHPDGGAFGAAVPLAIWEARLQTLKSLGVNGVRNIGDPFPPEFQALCQRLGFSIPDQSAETNASAPLGIIYLGGADEWPEIATENALLDRTGAVTPLGREYQSRWDHEPMLAMARRVSQTDATLVAAEPRTILLPDWTPENQQPHTEKVEVYSNCRDVELFLNGKSLGKKAGAARQWEVPFAPGTLRAVGHNVGGLSVTNELRTAGKPVRIVLSTDSKYLTPAWVDVAVVRAVIVDAKGTPVPSATDLISFKAAGPAAVAAVDNADNASHEPFQAGSRHAYQGCCVAFLKATAPAGKITLTATATGLKSDSVTLTAAPETK